MAFIESQSQASTAEASKDFLSAFEHYIRIDLSYNQTNPNAPYEVVEYLQKACTQLCQTLTASGDDGSKSILVSAVQWPSLFAFSAQESATSAAAKQLRGCFLIGLMFEDDGSSEQDRDQVVSELAEWEEDVREHRVFVDEPKMPALSSKVVVREQLGQLISDRQMWPHSHGMQATLFTALPEPQATATNQFYVRSASDTDLQTRSPSPRKLRSSEDVLKRIRWDDELATEDYNVVYLDRFVGYLEIPVIKWKSDTSEDEFIPLHRITGFRKTSTGEVVWSREARLDKIFGS